MPASWSTDCRYWASVRSGTARAVSSELAPTTTGTRLWRPPARASSGASGSTQPSMLGWYPPCLPARSIGCGRAATTALAPSARRHAATSLAAAHPQAATTSAPNACASALLMATQAPLCISAEENSPAASGEASSMQVSRAPADSPNTSTLAGSPPNDAMLDRTHSNAATWSRIP